MEELKKRIIDSKKTINKDIVDSQRIIDEQYNITLDKIQGTKEYSKAKLIHDLERDKKNQLYGFLGGLDMALNLINEYEEQGKFELSLELDEIPWERPIEVQI